MKIVKVFVAKRVEEFVREVLCFAGIEEMYQHRGIVFVFFMAFESQLTQSWRPEYPRQVGDMLSIVS